MPPKFTGQRPMEGMGPRMITIVTAQVALRRHILKLWTGYNVDDAGAAPVSGGAADSHSVDRHVSWYDFHGCTAPITNSLAIAIIVIIIIVIIIIVIIIIVIIIIVIIIIVIIIIVIIIIVIIISSSSSISSITKS
jgi:hypothetical protein